MGANSARFGTDFMKTPLLFSLVFLGLAGCGAAPPDADTQAQMATTDKKSILGRSMDKGEGVATDSYIAQINQNVPRDENGKPPATLEELKKSLKDFPPETWRDGATGKDLVYNPTTGTVSR